MASKKTKWSMDEKIRIVLQTFNLETKVARAVPRAQLGSQNPPMCYGRLRPWMSCVGNASGSVQLQVGRPVF